MPLAKNIYIRADKLENLPAQNRENYIYETHLLQKELSHGANILQVGSMDGMRIIRLLELRPDLKLTGLELEDELVKVAKQNAIQANIHAKFITGDITDPPELQVFDYVICLNNTLGYIPKQQKALEEMKRLGNVVVISVYNEKFDDELAREYFQELNLKIEDIKNNDFIMKDFTKVKRYTKEEVISWGGELLETPIGYYCIIR